MRAIWIELRMTRRMKLIFFPDTAMSMVWWRIYMQMRNRQTALYCFLITFLLQQLQTNAVPVPMMDEAIEAAKASEVVIMVLGGSEVTVREERSRTSLNLPGRQEELLQEICKLGKPVVLVMIDGRASSINYAKKFVPAILHECMGGIEIFEK